MRRSAAAAQIELSDTLCVERLTAKNTAIITAKTGSPVIKPSAAPTDTPFLLGTRSIPARMADYHRAGKRLDRLTAYGRTDQHCGCGFTASSINVAIPAFMP